MDVRIAPPFSSAVGVTPLGDGRFAAELGDRWTVGPNAHGGILMALLGKAGVGALGPAAPDPLVVAAEFLRAVKPGPVELHTDVLKAGQAASVVAVRMLQDGRQVIAATVTAGRLVDEEARHADLPVQAVEPPADADVPTGDFPSAVRAPDLRLDPATDAFAHGETGPPVIRGWVRPREEEPDIWFGLLAGDILPPTVYNLGGRFGWTPTVQMTALLRAHPAPGWLRLESRTTSVAGGWFDSDVTVVDSRGRLVCQARQLAMTPRSA